MGGFSRKHDSLLHLLLFSYMLTVALGVLSVAPDDFVSSCTEFAEPGSFNNSNQKVLLDTQFYPSLALLTTEGENGLWISLDFDMTTGDGFGKVRKREESKRGVMKKQSPLIIGLTGPFIILKTVLLNPKL